MFAKIVKNDVLKNKTITAALFVFIMLSTILAASGTNMIVQLTQSVQALFTQSIAPHFVQMHAGDIDADELESFAMTNDYVKDSQVVEMLQMDGAHIEFEHGQTLAKNNVMDHYFVTQNETFDLLLNMDSEVIEVSPGDIAVPVYFIQSYDINLGDHVKISLPNGQMDFTVTDFVRDVQMNPAIIHSKRFVIHPEDLAILKTNMQGDVEYLIEYLLKNPDNLKDFKQSYQTANLPQKGPTIDYQLLKMLHAISDGVVAAIVILVSVLLSVIAILCMRYTMLTTMEQEYREIGVLKAIGLPQSSIKKIYLLKYLSITCFAALLGCGISLWVNHLFLKNMMIYIGKAPTSNFHTMIPFIAVVLLCGFMIGFCLLTLRKFNNITAVDALRSGTVDASQKNPNRFAIHKSKLNVHVFLPLRDIWMRLRVYRLLLVVFIICSFMMIVPVNFLNTLQSPNFVTYMGVEKSDIRIDVQQSDAIEQDFQELTAFLEDDPDVERFSTYITSQYKVINADGVEENMSIETGDFSTFPLEYVKGGPPIEKNEIALSYLNSKSLEKNIEETVSIIVNDGIKELVVSGIYQDVTNGGHTAKATLPYQPETVQWFEVSIDVKSHVDNQEKMQSYERMFPNAKVTDLQGYLAQTFGHTIDQIRLFTLVTLGLSFVVAMVITFLFLSMLLAKDRTHVAILKSIGFSSDDLRLQYMIRILVVLGIGVIGGTILANTIGEMLVSGLMSMMGASRINFVIHPFQAYIVLPFILFAAAFIPTWLSIRSIKNVEVAKHAA